jgi:hypothetical protein
VRRAGGGRGPARDGVDRVLERERVVLERLERVVFVVFFLVVV